MYRCHLRIYLVGHQQDTFDAIQEIAPLAHFTHTFLASEQPQAALAAGADLILADVRDLDADKALETLLSAKKQQADCIFLVDSGQLAPHCWQGLWDVWTAPLSTVELGFRFRRWQQNRRLQLELWQTGQYLEATINSVPNLIWYKDKAGIHEKVNDSFCRTVNKTKRQVEGRGHAYIWDVERDDPACIESEREVMETRHTCVSEETIQTGEGPRLLMTYKSPLYDWDGSVMGTVGVAIDITQERAYEQELVRKNRTLETLFATTDCGVMSHTLDGKKVLNINAAALRILGYSTQEDLEADGFLSVANTVVEEDKPKLRDCIRSLKAVGDNASVEYRVRHSNGEELHVMGNVKLMEENGEKFYQRFLLDCTEQRLQEKRERSEKERQQRELMQALSIDYNLAFFFDLDTGHYMLLRMASDADAEMKHLFQGEGPFRQEMQAYIQHHVHPEDQQTLLAACTEEELGRQLSQKNVSHTNYRVLENGEVKYHQMKVVRTGSWEKSRGVVMGFRSVDEEIRREMEKKNLLEDALRQANRASKAKSVFLSNMSHDIRTPMNAIVGFTSLAISHIDKQDQVEEYLKKIMTSGNHLLSLINDILDMSRIESGKLRLDEEVCSLREILHGLRSIVQADVNAKQLSFDIDTVDIFDEDIYCDKLRLNQVLLNLCSNAIKYTPAGGEISLRVVEKSGPYQEGHVPQGHARYEFRVKDTGIGMSQEFVQHIFEPFERERNSTISGIQGTGLGMAITKNIVDMMNGSIRVSSEQGVGSEFIVDFIFRLSDAPRQATEIPALKNCRALVVDDDFNTCDSVSYMLEQIGLRAEWTLSGKEAVLRTRQALARGDRYGVYVIDWLMPDMNGVEVARRIRKETGTDVPIIVLTAYDWSDIEEEARQAGVTTFCNKPLFLSELCDCLQGIMRTDAADAPNAAPVKQARHRTGRILLAEDNLLNQEIAAVILEEAGFTTEIADNGQMALEMLQKAGPGYYSLVLMDVQMPVMDGYAATKAIRALPDKALAGIPILAMTANAFEEDRQRALQCGMDGHIAKPIDIDKLFATLDTVLA